MARNSSLAFIDDVTLYTMQPAAPVSEVERLGIIMDAELSDPTEAWGVLNPAIARGRDGELYLFARVVAEGNYSRIRMARVLFDDAGRPAGLERLGFALEPSEPYELRGHGEGGCEDPRITFIPTLDCYVMTYTGYGPHGARVAIALSRDLFTWERLGVVDFGEQHGIDFDAFDNKDAFFFPEPVVAPDGTLSFACMHRPMTGHGSTSLHLADLPSSIWVSYVPVAEAINDPSRLLHLRQHRLVLTPEYPWEQVKVGGGPPPVLTDEGWLLFHHGIEDLAGPEEPRKLRYAAGAFVVDRCDVTQILWRSPEPIMIPDTDMELSGIVNNVVFPTGIDVVNDSTVDLYYGMADARIGVARVALQQDYLSREGATQAA